jgi:hypothetical protein
MVIFSLVVLSADGEAKQKPHRRSGSGVQEISRRT